MPYYPPASSATSGFTIQSKTTTYTAVINDFVLADTSGGAWTLTLPTAVGNSGKAIGVKKTTSDTNNLTVNTTSSQTYDGRASGTLLLRRIYDFAVFVSDGTNWVIDSKNEHEVVTSASSYNYSSAGADANYGAAGCSVTLGVGTWRIVHQYMVNTGTTGAAVFLYSGTGLYGADGGNSASAPTALGGVSDGDRSIGDINGSFGMPNSSTASLRFPGINCTAICTFTSSTTVYAVPRLGYTTAGNASVVQAIIAERIW